MVVGLGAYREVLADREARSFSLAGLVARMPLSMTGLGIVLLVSTSTGSFGIAGLVAAVGTVAGAVAAPLWGRLIDRVGQARVLVSAAIINALSVLALIATIEQNLALPTTLAAAVGIGLGFSSAGASVRARWTHRLADHPLLNTAFAVEAMLDEVVFIVGPVLVTFLATSIHPALGLVACVVLGLTGAVFLAAQRGTQPPVGHRQAEKSQRARISIARLLPITLASVAIGSIFGGMEVVVVAFARSAGVERFTGLMLLAWAFGSLLSGLIVGTIAWKSSPGKRFRISAVLLALSTVPLPFVDSPLLVGLLLVVSGFAISPTMIASVAVAQTAVPPSRLTEAFGWISTGLAAGLAAGAVGVGHLIDGFGAQSGFWGVVVAGGALIATTLLISTRQPLAGAMDEMPTLTDRLDTSAAEQARSEAQNPST